MTSKTLLWSVTLALPLAVLGTLEVALRVAGLGKDTPLFIANPNHAAYQLTNPDILARYFAPDKRPPLTLEPQYFLSEKPANGVRIVVQGGSTAAGFPYGLGASLAGMLEYRLRQSLPQHHVEVINTAMSAVNSYYLLDIQNDIIAAKPDAVLIYAGHNEYLGLFGVDSNYKAGGQWLTRVYFSLRSLAIVQTLRHLLHAATSSYPHAAPSTSPSRTFMSQAAAGSHIDKSSEKFTQGVQQFERNMRQLLATYHQHGIPVYIATVASNQQHQPPFASAPNGANAFYQQGEKHANASDPQQALIAFEQAIDHDLLRFRAPSAINRAIVTLAEEQHAVLVDVKQHMANKSPFGIIGRSLMLEHLHPNVQGYFILADAFYEALQRHLPYRPFVSHPIDQAWRHRPVIEAEEFFGYAQIQTLIHDFPFTPEPVPFRLAAPQNAIQQLGLDYFNGAIDWLNMMKQAQLHYYAEGEKNVLSRQTALKIAGLMADAVPHDPLLQTQAADAFMALGRETEATYYRRRATLGGWVK